MNSFDDKTSYNQLISSLERDFGKVVVHKCDIHGEYKQREKINECPKCQAVIDKEKEAVRQREQRLAIAMNKWIEFGLPRKFMDITIDDWVAETKEQKSVKDSALDMIDGKYKSMLMMGSCGTGKTMLATGMIKAMCMKYEVDILYCTASKLVRSIRDSWNQSDVSEQDVIDKYATTGFLVIDELGAGRCSEDDKMYISEILCDRYSADLNTLLISNLSSSAIKEKVLDERAAERLRESGCFAAMNWKSKR